LKIEYATYRDKTLPGSEEKWKLKISGYKNEMVAAEMLASMYDASLDQFYPHGWSTPYIWPSYYNSRNWQGNQNFVAVGSNQKFPEDRQSKYVDKRYDQLFGGEFGIIGSYLRRDRMQMKTEGIPAPTVADGKNMQEVVVTGLGMTKNGNKDEEKQVSNQQQTVHTKQQGSEVQVRKNFNETAFSFRT
jgi:hypothetical protein